MAGQTRGGTVYRGEPDDWDQFQSIYEEEFTYVEGEINGANVDVILCADCYNKAAHILGI